MESSSSLRVESDLKVRKAKSKAQFTNARRAFLVAAMSEQPESGIIKTHMDVLGEAAMQAVEAILSLAEVVETNAHLFEELDVLDKEFAEAVTRASDVLEISTRRPSLASTTSSSPATIERPDTIRKSGGS